MYFVALQRHAATNFMLGIKVLQPDVIQMVQWSKHCAIYGLVMTGDNLGRYHGSKGSNSKIGVTK